MLGLHLLMLSFARNCAVKCLENMTRFDWPLIIYGGEGLTPCKLLRRIYINKRIEDYLRGKGARKSDGDYPYFSCRDDNRNLRMNYHIKKPALQTERRPFPMH